MKIFRTLAVLASVATLSASTMSAQPTAVDIELGLLVDVSGSISTGEYNLQRTGYIDVFNQTTFWDAFATSGRSLAVSYSEWSGSSQQSMLVSWYQITDATSAATFATAIGGTSRAFDDLTAPGSAINWLRPQFGVDFVGARQLIDISGDGCQNNGSSTSAARDATAALGITINAITIGTGGCSLPTWYADNAVTASGFLEAATDFDDFGDAIERKIGREINVVPEPSTYALMAVGLFAVGMVSRRRNNKH